MSPEDPCASSGAFGGFCSTASEEIWERLFLGTVEDTTQPYDLMVQCLPNEVKLNNCVGLSPACISQAPDQSKDPDLQYGSSWPDDEFGDP